MAENKNRNIKKSQEFRNSNKLPSNRLPIHPRLFIPKNTSFFDKNKNKAEEIYSRNIRD